MIFTNLCYTMTFPADSIDLEKECGACGNPIVIYYDKTYNGMRGRCTNCDNNFPLE